MLTLALDGFYWKPIQSGTAGGTDRSRAIAMTGLPPPRFFEERYVLREPLSPHRAAELDGVKIDPARLNLPDGPEDNWLLIEGAGGVLVPITREILQAALFLRWRAPVILVARTALGTINHTLLTLEALKHRTVEVLGVIFVGDSMPDTERTISEIGGVKRLGRMPVLPSLDAANLRGAFATHFDRRDFEAAYGA